MVKNFESFAGNIDQFYSQILVMILFIIIFYIFCIFYNFLFYYQLKV